MNIGDKIGKWTVTGFAPDRVDSSGKHHSRVNVRCECGTEMSKDVYKLNNGAKMCKQCYLKIAYKNSIPFEHRVNNYELFDNYGIGYTSNTNSKFYFDIDDYDNIKDICWMSNKNGYIQGYDTITNTRFFLHRLVMGLSKDDKRIVDHINRKPNDCRKSNLRICTQKENTLNRNIYKNNKSGHTGVMFNKNTNKWISYINKNKTRYNLGYFEKFEDAVLEREKAEEQYFGEFNPK